MEDCRSLEQWGFREQAGRTGVPVPAPGRQRTIAMNHRLYSRVLAGSLGAWALVALAGLAAAQNTTDSNPGQPVLSGPPARDAGVPGQKRSFAGAGNQAKERVADRGLPPRVLIQALGVLRAPDAAEDVRLSAAQEEALRSIHSEFLASVRAYAEAHRGEIADLRSKLSPEARAKLDQRARAAGLGVFGDADGRPGKGADRPRAKRATELADHPADPMESPDKAPAAANSDERIRQRLAELLQAAPSPKDAQAKAMSVLRDPQRVLVKAEILRLLKIQKQTRAEGASVTDLSGLPENARRRLENLPPEQRQEAIQRFREQRARRGGGEPTPAPKPQDVNVPDEPPPPHKN
jgi:hypothetical protein